jgi:hypothetical protein
MALAGLSLQSALKKRGISTLSLTQGNVRYELVLLRFILICYFLALMMVPNFKNSKVFSFLITLLIGLLAGFISFWIAYYVCCYFCPPIIVFENKVHLLMPIGQIMISLMLAIVLGLMVMVFIYRKMLK